MSGGVEDKLVDDVLVCVGRRRAVGSLTGRPFVDPVAARSIRWLGPGCVVAIALRDLFLICGAVGVVTGGRVAAHALAAPGTTLRLVAGAKHAVGRCGCKGGRGDRWLHLARRASLVAPVSQMTALLLGVAGTRRGCRVFL